MTAVLDLPALAQGHETISGAPFPVACGTEAWNIIHLHQPVDYLVQSTAVNHVKLFGFLVFRLRLTVSADTGSGTAADL